MGDSSLCCCGAVAVDQLADAFGGKFNGARFQAWSQTAKSVIHCHRPDISEILAGRPCPTIVRRQHSDCPSIPGLVGTSASSGSAAGAGDRRAGANEEAPRSADFELGPSPVDTAVGQQHVGSGESSTSTATGYVPAAILWEVDDSIANLDEIRAWHRANQLLYHYLIRSTSGPAATFLVRFVPKPGMLENGIAAWISLVDKYEKNPSRQSRRLMRKQLHATVMSRDQDPDEFFDELLAVRVELQAVGEVVDDDDILDIIWEGIPNEYNAEMKHLSEYNNRDFDLDAAMYIMRNLYANRMYGTPADGSSKNGASRASRAADGRTSAEVCSFCGKEGHVFRKCFKRRHNKKGTGRNAGRATRVNSEW